MKEILLTILRNKNSTRADYRAATDKLASLLALEAASWLPQDSITVETPIAVTSGVRFHQNVILVPVLRSGLALLPPFLHYFPEASVGFIGMRRDEKTFEPHNYYINLPPISSKDRIIVLEPMIATGGSSVVTLDILIRAGAAAENILFIAVIAAPEGLTQLRASHPYVKLIVAQTDQTLNADKYIVPGLGDFGDRYFGT